MVYRRLTPKRGPRADEMQFLRLLQDGPVRVSSGPLGRCLKRGWCELPTRFSLGAETQIVVKDASEALPGVVVQLTLVGMKILQQDAADDATVHFEDHPALPASREGEPNPTKSRAQIRRMFKKRALRRRAPRQR